jgi:hypothetical protein
MDNSTTNVQSLSGSGNSGLGSANSSSGSVSLSLLERGWRNSSFSSNSFQKDQLKLDVFCTDPIRIDTFVFELWLDGYRGTS